MSTLHLLKTSLHPHQTRVRRTGFRATLRLRLFSISAWENFFCLHSLIALNWGVNQSDWCYCITKSALAICFSLAGFHSFLSSYCRSTLVVILLQELSLFFLQIKVFLLHLWVECDESVIQGFQTVEERQVAHLTFLPAVNLFIWHWSQPKRCIRSNKGTLGRILLSFINSRIRNRSPWRIFPQMTSLII